MHSTIESALTGWYEIVSRLRCVQFYLAGMM